MSRTGQLSDVVRRILNDYILNLLFYTSGLSFNIYPSIFLRNMILERNEEETTIIDENKNLDDSTNQVEAPILDETK